LKREILCEKCKAKLRKLFPTDHPYPGEHVKFVSGKSRDNCICDYCGAEIHAGDPACAFSIWADRGADPYREWESLYIIY